MLRQQSVLTRWSIAMLGGWGLLLGIGFSFFSIVSPGPAAAQSPTSFDIPFMSGTLTLHEGDIHPEGSRYVIVQFERGLSQTAIAALTAHGITPLSVLYNNAWLCAAGPSAFTEAVLNDFAIAAVSPWKPEYKLAPHLRDGQFAEWAVTETGAVKLLVTFFEDVASSEMASIANRYSSTAEMFSASNVWAVQVPPGLIASLMQEEQVQSIEEGPSPATPLNDTARAAMQVESVQQIDTSVIPPRYEGLSGKGIHIALCEKAFMLHPDFFDYSSDPPTSRFLNFKVQSGFRHATHVAGIIGGNGWKSSENREQGTAFQWRGMAPEVLLINGEQDGPDLTDHICESGYNSSHRVDASNHSYVLNLTGKFDANAVAIDRAIRGGMGPKWKKPHVWGVGNDGLKSNFSRINEGYYSTYSIAKNSIGVGATNSFDNSLAAFSSLGPTFDGRIKPDVMAPGCQDPSGRCEVESSPEEQVPDGLVSTLEPSAPLPLSYYGRLKGTSMATPGVTGTVALMLQAFVEKHGVNLATRPPLPSTIKALLIQTATDLVHTQSAPQDPLNPDTQAPVRYYAGPDFATGYGLVDAQAAVNLIQEAASQTLIRESTVFLATEPRQVYALTVPASAPALKVTLAWDDAEATKPTLDQRAARLINNLDLVLKGPSGQWYFPWRLDPLPVAHCDGAGPGCGDRDLIRPTDIRPAYQGPDARNNVEQVQVNRPQAGTWWAYVLGEQIQVDGQSFSLVANVPLTRLAPAPADHPKQGDLNGDNLVDHSDNLIRYRHIAHVPAYLLRDASLNMDTEQEVNIADILQTEPAAYPFFLVNQFLRVSTSGFQTIRDTVGCPVNQNFVARFKFTARLVNSRRSLHALVLRVQELSDGHVLKNADAGPGGIGALKTVPKANQYTDGILGPWESPEVEFVDVPLEICLKDQIAPFRFVVDVVGVAKDEESTFSSR